MMKHLENPGFFMHPVPEPEEQTFFVPPTKSVGSDNPKVHPNHYNNTRITPFDVWDDWKLDPYTATAVKYIKRAGLKEGESVIDDLEKAIDYLQERVRRLKNE